MTKDQLGVLILEAERQMYCTAKTILGNDEDCADAIQETIVKAFQKLDTLKKDKYAKTWLMRILINECYNLIRRKSRLVSLENLSELPERQQKEETDYSDLYQAVNALKDELKLPVVLYYAEDFSIREIAEILRVSEGAVQEKTGESQRETKSGAGANGGYHMRLDDLKKDFPETPEFIHKMVIETVESQLEEKKKIVSISGEKTEKESASYSIYCGCMCFDGNHNLCSGFQNLSDIFGKARKLRDRSQDRKRREWEKADNT